MHPPGVVPVREMTPVERLFAVRNISVIHTGMIHIAMRHAGGGESCHDGGRGL